MTDDHSPNGLSQSQIDDHGSGIVFIPSMKKKSKLSKMKGGQNPVLTSANRVGGGLDSLTVQAANRKFPRLETLNRRYLDPMMRSFHIRQNLRAITELEDTQQIPSIPILQQRKKEYQDELDRINQSFGYNDLTPRANPTRRAVLQHHQEGQGVSSLAGAATDTLFPTVQVLQQAHMDPVILGLETRRHLRRLNALEDSREIPYDIPAVRQRRDEYENEIRRIGRLALDRSNIGRNAAARARHIVQSGMGVMSLTQTSIDHILPPLTIAYTATGINNNLIRENYQNYLRLKRESQIPDIPALERRAKGYEDYIKEIDRLNNIFDRISGRRTTGSGFHTEYEKNQTGESIGRGFHTGYEKNQTGFGLGPDPSVNVINTAEGAENRQKIDFIKGAKQAVNIIGDLADVLPGLSEVPLAGEAISGLSNLIPDTDQYDYTFEREPSYGNTDKGQQLITRNTVVPPSVPNYPKQNHTFNIPQNSNTFVNVYGQHFDGSGVNVPIALFSEHKLREQNENNPVMLVRHTNNIRKLGRLVRELWLNQRLLKDKQLASRLHQNIKDQKDEKQAQRIGKAIQSYNISQK